MSTSHQTARRALVEEIEEEVNRDYASVLGMAVGIESRLSGLSKATQKTTRARVEGLKMALVLILQNNLYLSETMAAKRIRQDWGRWMAAKKEDEETRGM